MRKGKGFMRRVKQRWDATYPTDPRTAQNLIDNAKRFKKEGWGTPVNISQDEVEEQVQPQTDDTRTSLEWTTEMKIVLMILDQEELAKGRGFMKRVKDRWDVKYPEYQSASWQKLRDNAARFKKDPELKDLILVRQTEEIQRAEIEMRNEEEECNVAFCTGFNLLTPIFMLPYIIMDLPIFVIAEWATLLVDIRCPRGGS